MLKQVGDIEGLIGSYQDVDLQDDTAPGGVHVWFTVVSEELPYLTEQTGSLQRKNFVYWNFTMELGRSSGRRRVRDKVEFDEATGKWKVIALAKNGNSDIAKWKDEWNAFYRGISYQVQGTPLSVLFKGDPSRVEMYKLYQIETVEQLAKLNETDATRLGMGGMDDKRRAERFIANAKDAVSGIEVNNKLQTLEQLTKTQAKTIEDLTAKLTELLEKDIEERKPKANKGGRPARAITIEPQDVAAIAGVEGLE